MDQPIVTATVLGAVNLIVNSHPLGGSIRTTRGEFKYLTTSLQSGYIRTANFIILRIRLDRLRDSTTIVAWFWGALQYVQLQLSFNSPS